MITGPERLTQCPQEFQDRIDAVGGFNRYGGSNFKIVWGEADTIRAGGYWESDGFHGYRDVPRNIGPGWLILQWNAPELYSTPESYYVSNYDEATGLQNLGEYPYQGRYETLFTLTHKELKNNRLEVECMPLSNLLVDMIIPIVIAAQGVSMERKLLAAKELKAREDAEKERRIDDAMRNARLAFDGNVVSFARQGCRTNLVEKKMEQIKGNMARAIAQARKMRGVNTQAV